MLVTVRDTCPGPSPASLQRLFDPFYTTKATGLGMGRLICPADHRSAWGTIVGGGEWTGETPSFCLRCPLTRTAYSDWDASRQYSYD